MVALGTWIYTKLYGEHVGTDEAGNRYFRSKCKKDCARVGRRGSQRRWVVYKGKAEPSKVAPKWHGWLHHMTDDLPSDDAPSYEWEAEHLPNLTGTLGAYHPSQKASGRTDRYQAWNYEEV